jgi:cytoskeletal protein CcmA (bactofilin family)
MSKWSPKETAEIPSGEISTLLGKDAEVKGAIKSQGSMRIDGTIEGELSSAKTVTVGATGAVEGNITAENIIVSGRVKGSLVARGKILLESTARLEGDIQAARLAISEGAAFRGRSNTGDAPTADTRVKTPPVQQEKSSVASS